MKRRHALVVTAATMVVLTAVSSTGGFNAASAERGFDVAVVDDDRAFLGVEAIDQTVEAGPPTDVSILELENRLGQRFTDVDADVRGDEPTPPVLQRASAPTSLGIGQRASVVATVNCDNDDGNPASETWDVSVVASGGGVSVELIRSVTVTCERTRPAGTHEETTSAQNQTTGGQNQTTDA